MKKLNIFISVSILLCFFNITNAQDRPPFNETVNIYTYHNSAVSAKGDPEWDHTAYQKWRIKRNTLRAYNDIDYLGEATWAYNCHFYAWFKTENYPGTNYWVDIPDENWDDYSFPRVTIETYPGKVTYTDANDFAAHSAITTSTPGRYISKWGEDCLWEHDWDECPYATMLNTRRYYERLNISGPTNVCTSNSTFSITNLPIGVSAFWSVSPSNWVSPTSGSGRIAEFSGSCSKIGEATVTFAISSSVGTVYESKNFNSCGPDPSDIELETRYSTGSLAPKPGSVYLLCPNTHYHLTLINNTGCSASSLSWTLPTGWSVNYQNSNMISIYTNSSPGGQVILKGQTCCSACGSNVTLLTQYFGTYYSCGGYYMASPNPSSNYVDIDIVPEMKEISVESFKNEISISVFDKLGTQILNQEVNSLPFRLDTSILPVGEYMIRIITMPKSGVEENQRVETLKIIVSH